MCSLFALPLSSQKLAVYIYLVFPIGRKWDFTKSTWLSREKGLLPTYKTARLSAELQFIPQAGFQLVHIKFN